MAKYALQDVFKEWRIVQGRLRYISACTPQLDALAMRHEDAGLRLFAS